eukprot:snap_masked-scaffold42_size484952-processed-gene-1.1 protein:Tk06356 transcript:snap_masked-scaffold42_size484952-processed-gene-1.1-mRNA-1 annotation:"c-type lectin - galactose binding"
MKTSTRSGETAPAECSKISRNRVFPGPEGQKVYFVSWTGRSVGGKKANGVWLGGRLCSNEPTCPKESHWYWVGSDKKLPNRGDWSHSGEFGEPQPDNLCKYNGGSDKECLALLNNWYRDGFKWHDMNCAEKMAFICEGKDNSPPGGSYEEDRYQPSILVWSAVEAATNSRRHRYVQALRDTISSTWGEEICGKVGERIEKILAAEGGHFIAVAEISDLLEGLPHHGVQADGLESRKPCGQHGYVVLAENRHLGASGRVVNVRNSLNDRPLF